MGSKKMKVGVVFEGDLQSGGGYQIQYARILELTKIKQFEFVIIVFSSQNKQLIQSKNLNVILIKIGFFDKLFRYINRLEFFYWFIPKFKLMSLIERKLEKINIDLLLFLSPSLLSLDLVKTNYIITVWDLCHRDHLEFPEVNFWREFERREQLYMKSLKKAVAIIVESKKGKENIIKRYGIDENRIHIVPFQPSVYIQQPEFIDIKKKYQIENEYIYYPAQFWPHKNHIYILDAISILYKQGIKLNVIFSGSDKGNLNYVLKYAERLKISHLIKYIGFAPNEELYSLYKNALALVMPTYFGPTNIPVLEAFEVGIPVIYSDLEEFREELGDAVLYCDLKKPESLAYHLLSLLNSESLRKKMIEKGRLKLKELRKINFNDVLTNILEEYKSKMKCWKA